MNLSAMLLPVENIIAIAPAAGGVLHGISKGKLGKLRNGHVRLHVLPDGVKVSYNF